MSLRRRRHRGDKPKAQVDMTSLIDLTFLLLVTFIVTLPALEQGVSIMLPQAKTDQLPTKDKKANTVTIDALNRVFLNNKPVTHEELESALSAMSAEDPDVPVLVRGD
ncbi:MAG: biopolymer transporter ExbD, partial [Kiritimatiellae bacterium]|nr:biopolymer transporter ExbD [Kiritimatiellia bacterium]